MSTIKEYIQSRTKKGKTIADAMMEIAGIRKPSDGTEVIPSQVKDRITALKWLADAGFEIEEEKDDKDRPINIVNYGELYVGPRPPS